jgi:addiction module HigA family antidote
LVQTENLIRTFRCRDTQRLHAGERVRRWIAIEHLRVEAATVDAWLDGRGSLDADAAVRLSLFFGNSVEFWINLQAQHDARMAVRDLEPVLRGQVKPHAA